VRKTGPRGQALIRRWEGLGDGDKAKPGFQPYRDPVGRLTIGYGHLIQPGSKIGPDTTLTLDEVEALFRADLMEREMQVEWLTKGAALTQNQFDALVSFVFNMGAARFQTSTLRQLVLAGDHLEVPGELLKWCHARQSGKKVKLKGLLRRRLDEAALYLTPGSDDAEVPEKKADGD